MISGKQHDQRLLNRDLKTIPRTKRAIDKKPGHEELAEVTDLIIKSPSDLGGIGFTPIAAQCEPGRA